jgi:sterol desaturase/sphingolipid hydroxylase (fatty acid hydroxylase superfamily)
MYLLAASLPVLVVAFIVGMQVERLRPAQSPLSSSDIAFDAVYGVCHVVIAAILNPAAAFLAAVVVDSVGAGLIMLPTSGPLALASFAVYLLTRDFLEYAWHRAQHAVPALWAMHSLHHSEESYNVMTGLRHFWAEAALKTILVYPLLAILLDVPPAFPAIAGFIYFINHLCAHLNVRLTLGRFALWFMNPQYHRIHHSIEPQHIDKNFADLFPFWDVLFGTAVLPQPSEFPKTGLIEGNKPKSLFEGLIWPLRGFVTYHRRTNAEIDIGVALNRTHRQKNKSTG